MLKLNEILWEFTLQCNKNCKYCGSKSNLNKNIENNIDRMHIAKNIVEAETKEITITGGQPSVIMDQLVNCVCYLCDNNINTKILTNGNLFVQDGFDKIKDKCYAFGFSINEEQDIQFAKQIFSKIPLNKTTMITNFGSHNICLFEQLSKFAVNFATWQVQLTMGNNFQLDLNDIEKLKKNIDDFRNKKMVSVIEADNIVCGKCGAGINGCSICYNGDVIPCLSYRSWKNDLDIQGNVFNESLKDIWNNKFQFYRNREFVPCCKCITGIELLKKKNKTPNIEDILKNNGNDNLRTQPVKDVVYVYGVNIDPSKITVVYGVNIYKEPTSSL